MDTETYDLPAHWAPALVNGDYDNVSTEDLIAMTEFFNAAEELLTCLGCEGDGDDFRRYHDATPHGVLPCNVMTYTFATGDQPPTQTPTQRRN